MALLNNPRLLNVAGFVFCALLLAYAYYAQFVLHLEPCPLCIFQRVGVIATGILFLLAALLAGGTLARRVWGSLVALAALAGGGVSAWHVYIQHLPADKVPACGPGLDYMLDVFSFGETLRMVFTGSGECAEVNWRFLGLSMPEWMLIAFVGLAAFALWNNWRRVEASARQ